MNARIVARIAMLTVWAVGIAVSTSSQPPRSPMFRALSALSPVAYWSMEDGPAAGRFRSAVAGGAALAPVGDVVFAANGRLQSSRPLPTFGSGGHVAATIPTYTDQGQWWLQMAVMIPSEPAAEQELGNIAVTGSTAARYVLSVAPGAPGVLQLRKHDAAGAVLHELKRPMEDTFAGTSMFGRWVLVTIGERRDYPRAGRYSVWLNAADAHSRPAFYGVDFAGSTGRITSVELVGSYPNPSFGHMAVWVDAGREPSDMNESREAFAVS